MATDSEPDSATPVDQVAGYEPPIDGETPKEANARRARNRRRREKADRDAAEPIRSSTSAPPRATAGPGRPTNRNRRAAAVTGVITTAGAAALLYDEFDGTAIIEGAPRLGDALAELAERNPRVARALDTLTETSAWAEVGLAVGAIVLPIVVHHREVAALNRAAAAEAAPADGDVAPVPVDVPLDPSGVGPDAPVFAVDTTPAASPVPVFSVA